MKFKIGETVWFASVDLRDEWITCPDCGGTGRVRVIFHDDSIVSVHCASCEGYPAPSGMLRIHKRVPCAISITLDGRRPSRGEIRWHATDGRIVEENYLFSTEEEAITFAKNQIVKMGIDELDERLKKYRETRNWAWNASYHKSEIKQALQSIEYHTAKLNVASLKMKKERKS